MSTPYFFFLFYLHWISHVVPAGQVESGSREKGSQLHPSGNRGWHTQSWYNTLSSFLLEETSRILPLQTSSPLQKESGSSARGLQSHFSGRQEQFWHLKLAGHCSSGFSASGSQSQPSFRHLQQWFSYYKIQFLSGFDEVYKRIMFIGSHKCHHLKDLELI